MSRGCTRHRTERLFVLSIITETLFVARSGLFLTQNGWAQNGVDVWHGMVEPLTFRWAVFGHGTNLIPRHHWHSDHLLSWQGTERSSCRIVWLAWWGTFVGTLVFPGKEWNGFFGQGRFLGSERNDVAWFISAEYLLYKPRQMRIMHIYIYVYV